MTIARTKSHIFLLLFQMLDSDSTPYSSPNVYRVSNRHHTVRGTSRAGLRLASLNVYRVSNDGGLDRIELPLPPLNRHIHDNSLRLASIMS